MRVYFESLSREEDGVTSPALEDEQKEQFWQWESYADYLLFICFFSAAIGASTIAFRTSLAYQGFLGLASAGVEGTLGAPQFILNY
jgi:hypothetical protein